MWYFLSAERGKSASEGAGRQYYRTVHFGAAGFLNGGKRFGGKRQKGSNLCENIGGKRCRINSFFLSPQKGKKKEIGSKMKNFLNLFPPQYGKKIENRSGFRQSILRRKKSVISQHYVKIYQNVHPYYFY